MDIISRKIDKLGRIVLPMDFRKALGLEGEAEVVLSIRGNAITVKGAKCVCRICGSPERVSGRVKLCQNCIAKIKSDPA